MSSEQEEVNYWKDQVLKGIRGELETVQKAAAAWAALFTAVLGVFSAVTFAGGLTALDDLPAVWRPWIKGGTILAAVATLIAILYASKAAGTTPKRTNDTTWDGFRGDSEAAAQRALMDLGYAKKAGLAAAALVLAGSSAVLLVGPADAPIQVPTVVAVVNGQVVCGRLEGGTPLRVGTTPLTNVTNLTVVPGCPG
jgi:hypothetical protein